VRVTAVQLTSSTDVADNLARAQRSVRESAAAGAELVVLPEAAMHTFGRPGVSLSPVAQPLDGPWVTGLVHVAAETGTTVIAGMFETVPGQERVRNTVTIVDRNGLRGRYRKVHLFDALGWRESDRLLPGDPDDLLVLDIGDQRVGVLTCYDIRFPELPRLLVDAGATLLAVPSAWVAGPLKEAHWTTLVTARALENTCWVVAAGQGPPEYAGGSAVVDPLGVVVARQGEADGVMLAEADRTRVDDVRARLPVLEHRRYQVRPREQRPRGPER
jgi:predicted amidohydrolase